MKVKLYHFYFFILKLAILMCISFISLKIIVLENGFKSNIMIIIDAIFKFSIGLFMILFFSHDNCKVLDTNDRILLILTGFILILLIDFIKIYKIFFTNNIHE
jgi:hypothetical protein